MGSGPIVDVSPAVDASPAVDVRPAVDVVVAGGGPAGAATALTLARGGHRVLLADQHRDPDARGGAGFRIGEALPPAARTMLRDLGLWDAFRREDHLPCYGTRAAWGSWLLRDTDFLLDPNGHGWHLDRPRFDRFLRCAARAAGVEVLERTAVTEPRRDAAGWSVRLRGTSGAPVLRCGWLVDATGRGARLARGLGAGRAVGDRLLCLFTRWAPDPGEPDRESDRDSRTLIESGPDGWWYTALLPAGNRVVAYLTDPDLVDRAMYDAAGFTSRVGATRHVAAQLAGHGYRPIAAPRGASARSAWLDAAAGDRWLAVGDAALACDPVSSQGILTALVTGLTAGAALHEWLDSGRTEPVEDYRTWVHQVRCRYLHNHRSCYLLEQRWADRAFWARRAGGVIPGG